MRMLFLLPFLLFSAAGLAMADTDDGLIYPGAATVSDFRAEKVMYKPGEPVRFIAVFSASGQTVEGKTPPLTLEIWLERELEPPFLAVKKTIEIGHGQQRAELIWEKGGGDVFGHRAILRCRDAFGRVLAEVETLFDVAADWSPIMRLAAVGAAVLAPPGRAQEEIDATIALLRAAHLNALEMYTTMPRPYFLAPEEKKWPYQYGQKRLISADVLRAWGKTLHEHGMKYILYNEMSSISGPDEWKVWDNSWPSRKLVTTYFAEKGMSNPNMLAIKEYFAEQLAESIQEYGWDGILMDSATWAHQATAQGYDKAGKRLTSWPPGEVGYQFLKPAWNKARAINPEFRFLSQNATAFNNLALKRPLDEIYSWVSRRAETYQARRYSQIIDLYTAEIDSHNQPRDGRYPRTYEEMATHLNSIATATGRPLMAWGFFATPDYDEYSVAFARPYLATHFAARTQVHDYYDFYGGAISDGRGAPVSRAIIRYNRFMARFSYYLTSPELRWIPEPDPRIQVTASRPLFWNKTVYERTTAGGQRQLIVNLLNLPDDHHILGQRQIPPPAQNIVVRLPTDKPMRAAYFLSADDESLRPLTLAPEKNADNSITWHLPPVECWSLLVMVER